MKILPLVIAGVSFVQVVEWLVRWVFWLPRLVRDRLAPDDWAPDAASMPAFFVAVGLATVIITVFTMTAPALSALHFGLGGLVAYLLEGLLFHAIWRWGRGISVI